MRLDEVTREFTSKNPHNSYGYKLQRYIATNNGTNWAVTPFGQVIGPTFIAYDQAIQAVHDSNPIID